VFHGLPAQGISHFGELCSPEGQNRTNRPPPGSIAYPYPTVNVKLQMHRSWNIARRVDVGRHVWIYGRLRRRTYLSTLYSLRRYSHLRNRWRYISNLVRGLNIASSNPRMTNYIPFKVTHFKFRASLISLKRLRLQSPNSVHR